jgi:hypothetical protein
MFRNQVVVVPYAPIPLCGTNDSNLIKLLMDFSLYMDNMNSSCLNGFNAQIRQYVNEFVLESDYLLDHAASGVSLPINLLEHTHKLYTCSSWTSLPGLLPAMNVAWESTLLTAFLSSLRSRYDLDLETPHAVDRSIYSKAAATGSSAALILGGSNAGKLVDALVAGGTAISSITNPGWSISAASTKVLIPSISEKCAAMEPGAPAILYMLDNSCFKNADIDGEISPISKLQDGKHHVVGCLVVTPEVSMSAVMTNMRKLISACGERKVFVLTPLPRYLSAPCCGDGDHCTHLADPDSGIKICCALHRMVIFIRNSLRDVPNCVIINTGDVLSDKENAAPSDVLSGVSGWGAVHGSAAQYEKLAAYLAVKIKAAASSKRQRDEVPAYNNDGSQRSRGNSFSDGVAPPPPSLPAGTGRFREQMISYPPPRPRSGAWGHSS